MGIDRSRNACGREGTAVRKMGLNVLVNKDDFFS